MWREKRGDIYRYYEKYKDPLTGEERRTSVRRPTKTRADAASALQELTEKIRQLTYQKREQRDDLTLKELCDMYVAWQTDNNRPQTGLNADMHCRTLRKLIGDDAIVAHLNENIVSEKLSDENPVTYNERLRRFKSLMRWGFENGTVSDISYMSRLKRAKAPSQRIRNENKYLEHDEIAALLTAMEPCPRWKYLTRFLILTGLRIGEALALTNSDVDLENGEIYVHTTLNPNTGKVQDMPKTDSSERLVSIQKELREMIDEWIEYREKDKEIQGYRSRFFFCSEHGRHLNYQSYCKYLREVSERSIGRRVTPHITRHTHTALLAEAGIELGQISRRLGHSDSKVTQDIYYHVTKKVREKDAARLDGIRIM